MPRESRENSSSDKLRRATIFTNFYFEKSNEALKRWQQDQGSLPREKRATQSPAWVRSVFFQFNHFSTEIRFSAEQHVKSLTGKTPEEFKTGSEDWWERGEPILAHLTKCLHPQVGYNLIEALAEWLPHFPNSCLHWLRIICEAGAGTNLFSDRIVVRDVIKILKNCLTEHRDLLSSDQSFLEDFAAVLEVLFGTANAEALSMAESLDEFYR